MFPSALPIRHFLNPRANPSLAYGPEQARILNRRAHQAAFKEISSWDGYAATPLLNLEGMAGRLGIESLWYKDEGARFGLRSFKALGGIYGVFHVLQAFLEGETGIAGIPSGDFGRSRFAEILSDFTVTCASAANHGAAVAQGADLFGCLSVVFLPSHIPPHRVEAVEELGARTVSVSGSYDDAVEQAAREAERKGWSVVSDTTYPGYEEVPRHIMQGYTVLARECLACRNASSMAWKILEEGADAFLTIPDVAAEETVDILGRGLNGDPPILTQPSGAAGLTGLMAARFESTLAEPLSLGKDSRVLIIGSEGPA